MKYMPKILLATLLALPMSAQAQTSADEIRQILMENPEILTEVLTANPEVLNDNVINVLRENNVLLIDIIEQGADNKRRQLLFEQWAVDIQTEKEVNIEGRPTRGSEDAPVTLIAFSDFACTYCMQAAATVENFLAMYPNEVRFVFKQFVSDSPAAQEASRWFLAALAQDEAKGWNFYANLFSNQSAFFANPTATLSLVAEESGLDLAALQADLSQNADTYNAIIDEDVADAKALGFTGTPHFLMNDVVIRGALPLENFIDAYDFALENN